MTHSPEPWEFDRYKDICSSDDKEVASLHYDGSNFDNWKANGARIVACINGCAGINPEAVPELLQACRVAYADMLVLNVPEGSSTMRLLKKALSKAEGEQE
jgi:hypothetical protein